MDIVKTMTTETKILCECGHAKPLSKSNISAHRKRAVHINNMQALNGEPIPLENTIVSQPVKTTKPKIVKEKKATTPAKQPKTKKPTKKAVLKTITRRFINAISKVLKIKLNHLTHFKPQIVKQPDTSAKLVELQNVIDNCVLIIDSLKEEIACNAEVTALNDNRFDDHDIDPVYRFTQWTHKQFFNNRVIEEIRRMGHPIFKEEEETTSEIINEIIFKEEEKTTMETTNDIQIEIPEETTSEPINEIVRDEGSALDTYLKNTYGFGFDGNVIRIAVQIQYTRFFYYVYRDHYNVGDKPILKLKAATIELDEFSTCVMTYITENVKDFKSMIVVEVITDYEIRRKLEKIWDDQHKKKVCVEVKKDNPGDALIETQQTKKTINPLKDLPPEIINLIYEYARDDTAKKNFVKIFPACYGLIKAVGVSPSTIKSGVYNGGASFSIVIKEKDFSPHVYGVTLHKFWEDIEHALQRVHGYETTTWETFWDLLNHGADFGYDYISAYDNGDDQFHVLARELRIS